LLKDENLSNPSPNSLEVADSNIHRPKSLFETSIDVLYDSFPAMEIVGVNRRTDTGLGISIFHAFGTVLVTPLAYLIRNWVYLVLALSVPSFLILPYWW
jgi:hypothetical protein